MEITFCLLFICSMATLGSSICIFNTQVQSGDTCWSIATTKCGVDLNRFYAANPSLNNGNSCNNLQIGQTVCCPLPTLGKCPKTYFIRSGDTCSSIAHKNGITLSQLYSFNPWLNNGATCNNLQVGQILCGSAPGTLSSSNCIFNTQVQSRDTCWSIATTECRVDLNRFYAVNPGLNDQSCNNLKIGQTVCCPLPTIGSCSSAYFVRSGDTCWSIANKYVITLSQLYSFNPWLNNGANCNNLQIGEIVCGSAPSGK